MTTDIIHNRASQSLMASIIALLIMFAPVSYFITESLLLLIVNDVFYAIVISVILPALLMMIGALIGRLIKQSIKYSQPDWQFTIKQFKIEECEVLQNEYNKKFGNLIQNATFWHFMGPMVLIVFGLAVTLHISFEATLLTWFLPFLNAVLHTAILIVSVIMGYRASANFASSDFNLPFIREALYVAHIQSNIPAISHIRVAMDMGEANGFVIYKNPRVVSRIRGIEKQAYIETWSEEKGSISKMFIRLYGEEDQKDTVWWWLSYDRYFLKMSSPDEEGYYVRNPVPSNVRELGVKDIQLVTENAIAIIILEWLKSHSGTAEIIEILRDLGLQNIEST